jgi:hypothetical protein
MALTIAQYEEVLSVLREVPSLVDKLEARHAALPEDVLEWLRRAERTLTSSGLPDGSQIAVSRARLIEAGRGVRRNDLAITGRLSVRRLREATASVVLERGNEILQAVVAVQRPVFQEAERIARQIVVAARIKGIVTAPGDGGRQHRFVAELRDRIAMDPDLAAAHAHLVGLVGVTDELILLDRALPSVVWGGGS